VRPYVHEHTAWCVSQEAIPQPSAGLALVPWVYHQCIESPVAKVIAEPQVAVGATHCSLKPRTDSSGQPEGARSEQQRERGSRGIRLQSQQEFEAPRAAEPRARQASLQTRTTVPQFAT